VLPLLREIDAQILDRTQHVEVTENLHRSPKISARGARRQPRAYWFVRRGSEPARPA
jgi:hypothetical protein